MTTLVSGFIDRERYDPVKPLHPVEFYLEHGKAFLALDAPKVVFLEPHIISLLEPTIRASTNTTVVPFNKEEMEYWPERARFLRSPSPPGYSPTKDTPDYFMIILNKVDWCVKAAALNPYSTQMFTWVDFGINYILKDMTLRDAVAHLRSDHVHPETIRLPGCIHSPPPPVHLAQLVWKYCGGIFCGTAELLKRMQSDQRTVVMRLLDAGYATWEVTVWYYMNAPYHDWYGANHDSTMFKHF